MEIEDNRKSGIAESIRSSSIIKKLRGIKNIQIIVAIFIIAVGLIIYSSVSTAIKAKTQTVSSTSASTMTEQEQRLSSILSRIEGAGSVETMITTQSDGEIVGVLIIAQGAKDISVRLRLLDAASTALGVSKQVINVYSKDR